jgi:hypothetical protein
MMEVTVKVFDQADLKVMFRIAPEQYRKTLIGWMIREKGFFVGDKKGKDGVFTRKMMAKDLSNNKGKWAYNVAKSFKGYVNNTNNIHGMTLRMGVNLSGKSMFGQQIAKMQDGYKQNVVGNWMIIPNYEEMFFARPRKKAMEMFHDLVNNQKLFIVAHAGKIYYIDKASNELMFTGVKNITVPKQFNFMEDWESRQPQVIDRGMKAIDKTTNELAQGKFK